MKCPGQDSRYWKPGAIYEAKCPKCGHEVEFFKDEPARRCRNCGYRFINPRMDFGCASYCKYAEQCLGELPQELLAQRDELLKDRVAIEVKRLLGRDFKKISRVTKTARYAEEIVKEEGGEPAVVLSASYLRMVDGEQFRGEQKGTEHHVTPSILGKLGAKEELIDKVLKVIGYDKSDKNNLSVNEKVIHDAELIVELDEKVKDSSITQDELQQSIKSAFLTDTGRKLASKLAKQD